MAQPDSSEGQVWSIVLAAGSGSRFGGPKQFERIAGRRLVDHVVATAQSVCDGVVVVLPGGTAWHDTSVRVVSGGTTRAESVRHGLSAVPPEADVIVVHDAAHPLASGGLFRSVVDAVRGGADAAVPAVPFTDPIKRVDSGRVVAGIPRSDLVLMQTPHAFRAGALRALHEEQPEVIEETELIERVGGRIMVVSGDPRNIHVTNPEELEMAALLFERAEHGETRDPLSGAK